MNQVLELYVVLILTTRPPRHTSFQYYLLTPLQSWHFLVKMCVIECIERGPAELLICLPTFQLPQLANSSIEKATKGGYVLEEVENGQSTYCHSSQQN